MSAERQFASDIRFFGVRVEWGKDCALRMGKTYKSDTSCVTVYVTWSTLSNGYIIRAAKSGSIERVQRYDAAGNMI